MHDALRNSCNECFWCCIWPTFYAWVTKLKGMDKVSSWVLTCSTSTILVHCMHVVLRLLTWLNSITNLLSTILDGWQVLHACMHFSDAVYDLHCTLYTWETRFWKDGNSPFLFILTCYCITILILSILLWVCIYSDRTRVSS